MKNVNDLFAMSSLIESDITTTRLQIRGSQSKLDSLKGEQKQREECWRSLRIIQEKYHDQSIKLLEQMLNTAIKAIFDDQDYVIDIEITEGKRKGVKLWLVESKSGKEERSRIPTSVGGGIQVVLSFVLNVYLIRIYGLRPYIIMDESFTQISSQYLPNFIHFLKYLIDELGFTFLWVTHDERVLPYLTSVYEVKSGTLKKQ